MLSDLQKNSAENPDESELKQRQIAFLQAIHAFSEDPTIKQIRQQRHEQGVATIMGAVDRLEKLYGQRGISYTIYDADKAAVDEFLPFSGDFFQELGEDNNHKRISEWDRTLVQEKVKEEIGQDTFLVRDLCKKLMESAQLVDNLRHRISNTLQDVAWRDPRETSVTTENVSKLLRDAHVHEHRDQDAFWDSFRDDLRAASVASPDGSQLRTLLETISGAAERSGLFQAIDTLLVKKQ